MDKLDFQKTHHLGMNSGIQENGHRLALPSKQLQFIKMGGFQLNKCEERQMVHIRYMLCGLFDCHSMYDGF